MTKRIADLTFFDESEPEYSENLTTEEKCTNGQSMQRLASLHKR